MASTAVTTAQSVSWQVPLEHETRQTFTPESVAANRDWRVFHNLQEYAPEAIGYVNPCMLVGIRVNCIPYVRTFAQFQAVFDPQWDEISKLLDENELRHCQGFVQQKFSNPQFYIEMQSKRLLTEEQRQWILNPQFLPNAQQQSIKAILLMIFKIDDVPPSYFNIVQHGFSGLTRPELVPYVPTEKIKDLPAFLVQYVDPKNICYLEGYKFKCLTPKQIATIRDKELMRNLVESLSFLTSFEPRHFKREELLCHLDISLFPELFHAVTETWEAQAKAMVKCLIDRGEKTRLAALPHHWQRFVTELTAQVPQPVAAPGPVLPRRQSQQIAPQSTPAVSLWRSFLSWLRSIFSCCCK